MLLDFIRWLQGFVQFQIFGKYPERFINIVTKNGLSIWGTNKTGDILHARMYVRDYKRIRPYAKKSRVRLKIKSKHGLPFYIRRYKHRVGVLLGVFVFILVVSAMSRFVWTIDIVGLETVSQAQLLSVLKDNGLYIGAYKPSLSFTQISRKTMLELDDIAWMSINVLDSHASVELKEKAKSPKVDDYHQPANVKATRDGLIESINTLQGEAFFEAGSAVVKDQMIVSGVVEDKLGGVSLVRANAEVIAKTNRKVSFSLDKEHEHYEFIEPVVRRNLDIFNLSVPVTFSFAKSPDSVVRQNTDNLYLFDTNLPVSIQSTRIYEKQRFSKKLDEKTAQSILKKQAYVFESFALSNCEAIARDFDYSQTDSQYVLEVTYTCREDIAYQQDIDIENMTIERVLPTQDESSQ